MVTESFMCIAKICFELWSCKNENISKFHGSVLGTQIWDNVAEKKKELEVWDLKYAETYNPSIVSESFMYIAKICFEFWSSKNENIAQKCGTFCSSGLGTQLWDHVADKKKELEVWDLRYAETYNPSIVSKSCIHIAEIDLELWSSKNEKNLILVFANFKFWILI